MYIGVVDDTSCTGVPVPSERDDRRQQNKTKKCLYEKTGSDCRPQISQSIGYRIWQVCSMEAVSGIE